MIAKLLFTIESLFDLRQEIDPTATRENTGLGLGSGFKAHPEISQHIQLQDGKAYLAGFEVTWSDFDPATIAVAAKKYLGQK